MKTISENGVEASAVWRVFSGFPSLEGCPFKGVSGVVSRCRWERGDVSYESVFEWLDLFSLPLCNEMV